MQPAVGVQRLAGLIRHIVVTGHDRRTADAKFAMRVSWQVPAGFRVDDFRLIAWQHPADAAQTLLQRIARRGECGAKHFGGTVKNAELMRPHLFNNKPDQLGGADRTGPVAAAQ